MDDREQVSSMPGITILGAGVAGLALGHCLQKKGIPALILEKASSPSYHTYGITLRPWAYRPLADVLGEPVASFRSFVAVDNHTHNENGQLPKSHSQTERHESFRAHRGRLEAFLRKGLNIKYKHQLISIETSEQNKAIFRFKGDTPSIALNPIKDIIIGADGVHSELRSLLSPSFKVTTLPYVVFNGRRKVPKRYWDMYYEPRMQGKYLAEILVPFNPHPLFGNQHISVRLQIYVDDYEPDGEIINISYTYSRPSYRMPGKAHDPLHRPNRSKEEATQVPDALFEELKLVRESGIAQPFLHTFDPVRVRKDRMLHWLMRSGVMGLDELERCARFGTKTGFKETGAGSTSIDLEDEARVGGFLFIGDAIHPTPILGGEGANDAIRDGIELAEHIARHGYEGVNTFYTQRVGTRKDATSLKSCRSVSNGSAGSSSLESEERRTRWDVWRDGVEISENVIRKMHGVPENQDALNSQL